MIAGGICSGGPNSPLSNCQRTRSWNFGWVSSRLSGRSSNCTARRFITGMLPSLSTMMMPWPMLCSVTASVSRERVSRWCWRSISMAMPEISAVRITPAATSCTRWRRKVANTSASSSPTLTISG